ncbi:hypothetical protein CE91St19_32520 [Odoribacter laneus]|nr:hypothetical protein CE91St19_32520 [Odoribacter laneus]GKI27045.1 hypothetical protein CE91St20_31820 [Odoribacter laneus]
MAVLAVDILKNRTVDTNIIRIKQYLSRLIFISLEVHKQNENINSMGQNNVSLKCIYNGKSVVKRELKHIQKNQTITHANK